MSGTPDNDEVKAAYRLLAKAHHPDIGGNTELMKAVNLLHDASTYDWGAVDPDSIHPQAEVRVDVDPVWEDASSQPPEDFDPNAFQRWVEDGCPLPRGATARLRAMSAAQLAAWRADRYKARTDLIWLANNVLMLDLAENPHRGIAALMVKKQPGVDISLLDTEIKKRLICWPRNLGKTFCVRSEIIQWLLNYPNIRIAFLTGSESIALPQLRALRHHLSHPSKKMRELFPEYCTESKLDKTTKTWSDTLVSESRWGTMHSFNVPCRNDFSLPEANFTLATEESNSTGAHYDIVFVDDLMNATNYRTPTARAKTHESFLAVLPLLMAGGYLILTGTRYHVDDVYAKIMAVAVKESKWLFSIRGAYSTNCSVCGKPECFHDWINDPLHPGIEGYPCAGFVSDNIQRCLCPEITCANGTVYGHSLDFLTMQKLENEAWFYCQFMNAPQLAVGEAIFTEALINQQTIQTDDQFLTQFPRDAVELYVGVDLAYSGAELGTKRDESVMYVFVKYAGQIAIRNAAFGQWNASQRVDQIVNLLRKLRPRTMFVEANLNHQSTQLLVEAAARASGLNQIPIVWMEPNRAKGAKNLRIENSEHMMKTGRLWLFAGMPGYEKLKKQLLDWPNGSHDDHADCLAICCEAATSSAIHQTAENAAEIAHASAEKLETAADYVRHTDAQAIANDVENVARRYPWQALALAATLGLLVGLLFQNRD